MKMHIDKFFDKFKTKLIIKDFFQICDVNYFDTFASMIRFNTLHLFMIIMTLENLECH